MKNLFKVSLGKKIRFGILGFHIRHKSNCNKFALLNKSLLIVIV